MVNAGVLLDLKEIFVSYLFLVHRIVQQKIKGFVKVMGNVHARVDLVVKVCIF